jgi:hypothetical protein
MAYLDEGQMIKLSKKKEIPKTTKEYLKQLAEVAQKTEERKQKEALKIKENKKLSVTREYQLKKAIEKYNVERAKRLSKIRLKEIQRGKTLTALRNIAVQQQQSQKREGIIQQIGTKAEKIEHIICSASEVPFLENLERTRMSVCSPPHSTKLIRFEKKITDSFPA